MRKTLGLLFAASLLVPVGVIAAGPAGAAAKVPTCKTLSGKQTYSPALPKIGVATKVNSNVTTTANIGGCTGGGVTSGKSSSKSVYKGNCTTLVTHKGATKGSATIKWSNGKTSSVSTSLTTTSKPGASPVLATLVSKFTAGAFKGTTSTVHLKATPPKDACTKKSLTGYVFVNVGKFVTK